MELRSYGGIGRGLESRSQIGAPAPCMLGSLQVRSQTKSNAYLVYPTGREL